MFKMGSHRSFGHLKHKLWSKEKPRVKLTVWFLTTKSQESTRFPCVQATCNTPLKSSWRGLQLCFGLHCKWWSTRKVMQPQSRGSSSCGNFGTPTWESWDKKAIWMWPPWRGIDNTIRGKVVASPKSGPWWVLWVLWVQVACGLS
jgi:hypothetical protein